MNRNRAVLPALLVALVFTLAPAASAQVQVPLSPTKIPQFVQPLDTLGNGLPLVISPDLSGATVGSLPGTLLGSFIVGEVYAFGIMFKPELALAYILMVMAVVLIISSAVGNIRKTGKIEFTLLSPLTKGGLRG